MTGSLTSTSRNNNKKNGETGPTAEADGPNRPNPECSPSVQTAIGSMNSEGIWFSDSLIGNGEAHMTWTRKCFWVMVVVSALFLAESLLPFQLIG